MTLDLSDTHVALRTISMAAAYEWLDPDSTSSNLIFEAIGGIEDSVWQAVDLVRQGKTEIAYAVICITKSAGNS